MNRSLILALPATLLLAAHVAHGASPNLEWRVRVAGLAVDSGPRLSLSASALSFPLVDVGSLATGQSVTVQNLSSAPVPLGVGSVTAPFEIASTDCPATLAPKQSCSYTFSFRPTQAGPSASTLSVGLGADAQALSLSGRGAVLVSGTRAELETFSATAPTGTTFVQVVFASFGVASGTAPNFVQGTCHATASASVVAAHFLNKGSGSVLVSNTIFGDPCLNVQKKLYVVLRAG